MVIDSLTPLTAYDFYIRPVCSADDTARWEFPTTLTTGLCDDNEIFAVGSATSSGTAYYAPVNNFYKYTLSEVIVDSTEIGEERDIDYIGYFYDHYVPMTDKTNCTIYFQPTTLSAFSSSADVVALDPASAVRVYTGPLNCSQGWNYFALDTTYHYNGSGNLMVIVDDNSGGYNSSSCVFKTEPCTDNKTLFYYSDSYTPDAAIVSSSYSGTKAVAMWRPVMQFVVCLPPYCHQPEIADVTSSYESATISWTGDGTTYQVNIKETAATDWLATDITVTGNSYTFTGLQPITDYEFRLRQDCNADSLGYSDWVVGTLLTDSMPCFPPDSIRLTSVTSTTATIDWIVNGHENAWDIHVWYGTFDSTYRVNTRPATVGGFTAGLTYNMAIHSLCNADMLEGGWSDTVQFTTAICPDVTGLTIGNVTNSSVTLNWDADSMAQGWIIEYGPTGFTQGQGTEVNSTTNSYVVTGLSNGITYDFYVKAVCGSDWTSENWVGISATTSNIGIDEFGDVLCTIHPNPASSAATISVSGVNGMIRIAVVDMNGRTVATEMLECSADCEKTMEVDKLAKGAYFVRISADNTNMVRKLIVR